VGWAFFILILILFIFVLVAGLIVNTTGDPTF